MKIITFILSILLLISGCATTSFIPYGAINYPPKPLDYIIPIISVNGPQPVESSYIILGNIEASKDAITIFDKVNLSEVIDMVKKSAKEKGADALIKVHYWNGPATGRHVDSIKVNAVAIVFKNSDEAFKQLKEMGIIFK